MTEIRGAWDKRFKAVRDALAESLDDQDVGASAAVFVDGEPVVDIWGGYADAARTVPWQRDTIVNVFSATKTVLALCALILADRGDLDLDAPVARYWPEFAAAGKEGVLVRHVLAHTAGLPYFGGLLDEEELYDWAAMTSRLAAKAPSWEPGMLAGYHSVTEGYLIGEVVRRITGQSVGAFFAAEVAGPLGADFQFTLPAQDDRRFAPGIVPPGAPADWRAAPAPGAPEGPTDRDAGVRLAVANSPTWRRTEIPSGSGYGNARSLALVQSVLACGGTVGGVRLLSQAACERAWEEQYRGIDQVLGVSMRYGMGYGIFDRSVGWGGWGGALVTVNYGARMVVAYTMNQMLQPGDGESRGIGIVIAAHEGLQA